MTTLGDGVYSQTVLEHLDSATRMQDRWCLAIGSAAFVGLMVFNMVYGPVVHLWHAVFNFGFPVACILTMHCSFMVWVHSVAVRGVAARDSAYYHARATADARAAGEAQAEAAGALQSALGRFGGNADDVAVALVQEGPHVLATVATSAGIRRILGTYERERAAAAAPASASAPTSSVSDADADARRRPARSPARRRPAFPMPAMPALHTTGSRAAAPVAAPLPTEEANQDKEEPEVDADAEEDECGSDTESPEDVRPGEAQE